MFPRPVSENLENLDSIPVHQLNPKFQEALRDFKYHVLDRPDTKWMYGKPMTGEDLATYAEYLANAEVPVMQDGFTVMIEQ